VKEAEDDILAELGANWRARRRRKEKPPRSRPKPAPAPRKGLPRADIKIDDEHGIELADDLVIEEAAEPEAPAAAGAPAAGGTFGGLFANKLKAALKKKREEGKAWPRTKLKGGETASRRRERRKIKPRIEAEKVERDRGEPGKTRSFPPSEGNFAPMLVLRSPRSSRLYDERGTMPAQSSHGFPRLARSRSIFLFLGI